MASIASQASDWRPRRETRSGNRQVALLANDALKGQLDLQRHDGRATEGVFTRIAPRLVAMAACIWHSWPRPNPSSGR